MQREMSLRRPLYAVVLGILMAGACLADQASMTPRDELRRLLWMGSRPDPLLAALTADAIPADSALLVSAYLSTGDSAAALSWLPSVTDTTIPGWEAFEGRRLLLLRGAGHEVTRDLVALWRRVPTTSLGRRSALAALDDGPGLSVLTQVRDHLSRWPADDRARAWWRMAARYDAEGMAEWAVEALWKTVETQASPLASLAAGELVGRVDPGSLDSARRMTLASALLAGGKAEPALCILPASPSTDAEKLLRARCLLAAGRCIEGMAALTRLSRRGTSDAADALWYLASHQKRIDADSLAAETYHSLVQRFPAHARAQAAAWDAAWAFERTGQLVRAGAVYREGIRRWPRGSNADNSRFRWGLVAWRTGEIPGAVKRWTTTWPYLRDDQAKAAVAYWVGKGSLMTGSIDEAFLWWRRAEEAAPGSFYGLRARHRLNATVLRTRRPPSSGRIPPDLGRWLRTWSADTLAVHAPLLDRARVFYDAGLVEEVAEELSRALDTAGRSPGAILAVAEQAGIWGSPGIEAVAGSRLAQRFRSSVGRDPPAWMERLALPIPFPGSLIPITNELTLDPCLVSALIRKESFYDRTARSRAGAMGLMQLMPQTAVETSRLRPGLDPSRRTEVATNLWLGCLHLREVLDAHGGNAPYALAAYNAGPNPLRRWIKTLPAGDPELWVECITYGETRYYIKTVLAFAWRYREAWPELGKANPFESLRVKELNDS